MSASEHLNPDQLRLFMQAKELMNVHTLEATQWGNHYRTMNDDSSLYLSKVRESVSGYEHDTYNTAKKGQENLYDSIKKEGVKSPVTLSDRAGLLNIENGHHRIAAANAINEDMYIPVRYE